ncbi:MAG TPA: hypothetical protein VJZ76_20230 [Thermoanaerobaculia bacterium]|nr:hypothetical protein [Thermoanaerobaculia bacterium]
MGRFAWRLPAAAFLSLLLLPFLGCHRSGTWIDDPKNFERALGESPPPGLRVIHSWYWRSPHFFREEIYYFELSSLSGYAEAFAAENGLRRLPAGSLSRIPFDDNRPAWFAPGPLEQYELWRSPSDVITGFILRDKTNGEIFIYCKQL